LGRDELADGGLEPRLELDDVANNDLVADQGLDDDDE
jgi:hypothetical protein